MRAIMVRAHLEAVVVAVAVVQQGEGVGQVVVAYQHGDDIDDEDTI